MPMTKRRKEDLREVLTRPKRIDDILEEQLEQALSQHERSNRALFISAISAGLDIGFSIFLMGVLHTLFADQLSPSLLHVLLSLAYPLGFIFVVIGRTELFTEHTTLAVIPVLNRSATIKSLLILWGIIYAGNLIGGSAFGAIMIAVPAQMEFLSPDSLVVLAEKMIDYKWTLIIGSCILAGWLMGLLSWLITSSQDSISRIFIVVLITSVIGIGGLHHAIVGSIEVFSGMLLSPDIGISDYLFVLLCTTLGNIIGGVVFVALIKYSYIRPLGYKRSKAGSYSRRNKKKNLNL